MFVLLKEEYKVFQFAIFHWDFTQDVLVNEVTHIIIVTKLWSMTQCACGEHLA